VVEEAEDGTESGPLRWRELVVVLEEEVGLSIDMMSGNDFVEFVGEEDMRPARFLLFC
jgi:hypothetical protein